MEIVKVSGCTKCNDFMPISHFGDGKCSRRSGTGRARKLGRPKHRVKCPKCKGSGRCTNCRGRGVI